MMSILALAAAGAPASPPPPAPAGEAGARVEVRAFAFTPARIEVRPGERVTWANADPVPHTATAMDGAWDTGEMAGGAAVAVRFAEPGVYAYICAYHPQMRGEVVVVE